MEGLRDITNCHNCCAIKLSSFGGTLAEGFEALQLRKIQNGNIEYYLLGMVAGLILLLLSIF